MTERTWTVKRGTEVIACQACRARIAFAPTLAGRKMPVDIPVDAILDPVEAATLTKAFGVTTIVIGYVSKDLQASPHWATCTNPSKFRTQPK